MSKLVNYIFKEEEFTFFEVLSLIVVTVLGTFACFTAIIEEWFYMYMTMSVAFVFILGGSISYFRRKGKQEQEAADDEPVH